MVRLFAHVSYSLAGAGARGEFLSARSALEMLRRTVAHEPAV